MKQIIKKVLKEISDSQDGQLNLDSETARTTAANLISAALKSGGEYKKLSAEDIEIFKARETWVCDICGKSTYDVDYDYIGSGTNHLGCELELNIKMEHSDDHREHPINTYFTADVKDKRETNDRRKSDRREKTWAQKKHEEKVFPGVDAIQKQAYLEMTSDGLPAVGDTQAVLESHKLAEEIVDSHDDEWIYESPDGGKTVFRRPFGDYDMKNKVEINWETKKPTGRKFTDYPFEDIQISGC